jgi:hypothetical protein
MQQKQLLLLQLQLTNGPDQYIHYPINILQHIIIPEAGNLKSKVFQILGSDNVALAFRMLPTVDFNDKFQVETGKIRGIGSNRNLPAKFDTKMVISDTVPKNFFGIRLIAA